MQIITKNLKKSFVKLKIQNLDDLWYLSNIINKGDLIRAQTTRKIKIGKEEQRKQAIVKKKITLTIKVEKIDYKADVLRVSGEIIECPEDVQKGSWHSFNLTINSVLTITKEEWLKYQLDWLKQASKEKIPKILICCFDREEAYFALLKRAGYEILSHIKGKVVKKAIEEKLKTTFWQEIAKQIKAYDEKLKLDKVIIASPSFWKEYLVKEIKEPSLKEKIVQASCSSVDKTGLNEILKRPELVNVLKEERVAEEVSLVEQLLIEIKKQGKVSYGLKETETAITTGAVQTLLVTDSFLKQMREQEKTEKINELMKLTEQMKGSVAIISSEHEGGKKLDSLGGIGALLRYRIS